MKLAVTARIVVMIAGGVAACDAAGQEPSGAAAARPTVGAIRWDAWHGDRGVAGKAVEETLGPVKWHNRLPFYARVIGPDRVRIDGTSQEVVDREIELAVSAGLDYWAFVTYSAGDPMSIGLRRYLASERRSSLHFCLITECGRWGSPPFVDRVVGLMQEAGYRTVLQRRPLVYIGFITPDHLKTWPDGIEGLRKVLDGMRAEAVGRGLARPYVVIMDGNPRQAKQWADALDGDAISSYAIGTGGRTVSYGELVRIAEGFWGRCAETGVPVVPLVTTGWDRRPRVERPVPWEGSSKQGVGLHDYALAAKPEEIAGHLADALRWLGAHPREAPSQSIVIYAWNELDEGGWLVPTVSEGVARLEAIGKVLRRPR